MSQSITGRHLRKARLVATTALVAGGLMLAACSTAGSPDTGGSADSGSVEIKVLSDNSEQMVARMNALLDAFNATGQGVTVLLETRAQGTDGDNIVKTKLATGEMEDIFQYNSGSLMAALDPARNMVDLTNEAFQANINDAFKTAVTSDGKIYGAPLGTNNGGGMLYNKLVYSDLGLSIPKTWDEFMANNAKIKAAGIDPVIQTYGETWTSQLFVLADFHNVLAQDPDWATKYTAGQAKYADQPALAGFQRLQEVHDAGFFNKDFASASSTQGLQALVDGTGAQYPILTFTIPTYLAMSDDAKTNIGFFAQPGENAADFGLTAWMSDSLYIPSTTTGAKLDAAKKFLAWVATPAACDALNKAQAPTGPYNVNGCAVPDDSPQAVKDLQQYFADGNVSVALEFLSPLKGPNLEKITVEVGSGMSTAEKGAATYDEDVVKQAQQLGLEGW